MTRNKLLIAIRIVLSALLLCVAPVALSAQEPSAQEPRRPAPPAAVAPIAPIAPSARLLAARSIYIEHHGGRLPNDVIGDAFQGWGRYTLVADPAQADLIVSINAPLSPAGVSVGGGHNPPPAGTSSEVVQIRLVILDAHDRVVLWSGNEQPKSSFKEKQREDNAVDASLRLFRRFRNVVEPEPAP